LLRLFDFKTLDGEDLQGIAALMERAYEKSSSPAVAPTHRKAMVAVMARTALLSYHDVQAQRLAMDGLRRLQYSLNSMRIDADQGMQTVNRYAFRLLTPEARKFILDALLEDLKLLGGQF